LPLVADFDRDAKPDVAVEEINGAGVFYIDGSQDD